MSGRFRGVLVMAAAAVALDCHRTAPPNVAAASAPSGQLRPARTLSLEAGAPIPAPFAADPRWQAAARGSEIDLSRLADAEGPSGLLGAIEKGGDVALVALSAVPLCPDAGAIIGRLCEWIPTARPPGPLLDAIARVVAHPPAFGEALDVADSIATCDRELEHAVAAPDLSAHDRDLAASARAMLGEWNTPR